MLFIFNFDFYRPERECPELADPRHGQVSYTGRHFQVMFHHGSIKNEIIKLTDFRTEQRTAVMKVSPSWVLPQLRVKQVEGGQVIFIFLEKLSSCVFLL